MKMKTENILKYGHCYGKMIPAVKPGLDDT